MPLAHLVYASSATRIFDEDDLIALLEKSRRNNTAIGITGLLLYRDGNFIQVLEGETQTVVDTHARIARDHRHAGLVTFIHAPIEQRTFSEWSMGFRNLDSTTLREVPGYSDYMNDDWCGAAMRATPDRALMLLQLFRRNMR